MSVQASVVLTTARTLLNDDAATLWTDTSLFPKLAQAHRELQTKLRFAAAPVMRAIYTETLAANATVFVNQPTNMVEPITLQETDSAGTLANFTPMTEADPLPNIAPGATLVYWQWADEIVTFIGSTASRTVKMVYWRSLVIPTVNTALIGFINGELYLAPRVAALAAASVGNKDVAALATGMAEAALNEVILSNRGRAGAASGQTMRP